MAIVVNREIAGDLNNPTAELLNYCIQEHMKMLRRLEKLSDYYDGKHDITKRKKENEAAPNNKILVNHAKYVVDMNVGSMVGNPISYVSDATKNIQPVLDVYNELDIVSHDTELEKDLSTFGIAYELLYLARGKEVNSTEIRIKCIDPRGIFLVTDDTVDKNSLFAVHYQPVFDLQGGIVSRVTKKCWFWAIENVGIRSSVLFVFFRFVFAIAFHSIRRPCNLNDFRVMDQAVQ